MAFSAIKLDEHGEPMNSPEELAFDWLGDVTLHESMTFEPVVNKLHRALPDKTPEPQLMRIRDRLEKKSIWYTQTGSSTVRGCHAQICTVHLMPARCVARCTAMDG